MSCYLGEELNDKRKEEDVHQCKTHIKVKERPHVASSLLASPNPSTIALRHWILMTFNKGLLDRTIQNQ
jgi:hypothetical protein